MKKLRWIAFALGLFALGMATQYTPDLPLESLKAQYAPPPSKFLPLEGLDVHYRDEGSGPPVLLLHGTGASLQAWDAWTEKLRTDHRVVRLDLPGFGLTGPARDGDYTIAKMVAFVNAFAERLGLDKFAVAGNSWGGEIAWSYALDHPDRVSALILVDAAGLGMYGQIPLGFRLAGMLPAFFTKLGTDRIVDKTLRQVYGDPSRITEAQRQRYHDLTRREGNRAAVGERIRAPHIDRSGELGMLKIPTLILWGSEDHLLPVAGAEKFHAAIAGSRLKIYPGAGHIPHEEVDESAADAAAFLR